MMCGTRIPQLSAETAIRLYRTEKRRASKRGANVITRAVAATLNELQPPAPVPVAPKPKPRPVSFAPITGTQAARLGALARHSGLRRPSEGPFRVPEIPRHPVTGGCGHCGRLAPKYLRGRCQRDYQWYRRYAIERPLEVQP